ncbi:hypothetical protein DFH27DRAFT_657338 [Peziza echinospora]|nr:hypothetical protein DFH27DRAFT_657338 [Peziza echinospora]
MSDLAPPSAATPAPTLPPPPPATATAPPPPPPPPLPPQAIIEHQQTLALIRRILRPQSSPSTPLEDILPALTSSPQVDVQLYADFIFAWYSKITNDRSFVDEVITVIAHTTRSLEQRTRQIDLEVLLLDELPSLLDNHVRVLDFRQCVARHKTCLSPHLTLEESFHNLQPHPALGSSPEKDLQSNCERTLIREILSGMVFGNVVDKLSEPWMLYEIITKLLAPQPQTPPQLPQPLITLPSPAISMPPTPITPLGDPLDVSHADVFYSDSRASPLLLPRDREKAPGHHRRRSYAPSRQPPPLPPSEPTPPLHPILQKLDSTFALIFNLIMFITTLTNIDKRQPWLTGNILLALSPITTRPAGSFVDTFISDQFQKAIVSQALVINILSSARASMFPNGAMGPARPYPTLEEKHLIRQNAKRTLLERIPEVVWRHYVSPSATDGKREAMVDEWLDLFCEQERE